MFFVVVTFGSLENQVFRTVLKSARLEGALIVCGMKPSWRPSISTRIWAQSSAGHVTAPGKSKVGQEHPIFEYRLFL